VGGEAWFRRPARKLVPVPQEAFPDNGDETGRSFFRIDVESTTPSAERIETNSICYRQGKVRPKVEGKSRPVASFSVGNCSKGVRLYVLPQETSRSIVIKRWGASGEKSSFAVSCVSWIGAVGGAPTILCRGRAQAVATAGVSYRAVQKPLGSPPAPPRHEDSSAADVYSSFVL
jgi:hypothetical protein